ncbi:MAG TPA: hypothetical protein VJ248_05060, partial [Candidatus Udaeobacter sp.]|nr:hypothetical protein [Candidatus Udaeobacter sp.]
MAPKSKIGTGQARPVLHGACIELVAPAARKGKLASMNYSPSHRIFFLSPAYAGGERARMILSDRAEFELARKLRDKRGAPIAEVFTFLSGLYFRGKIAYATTFERPAPGMPGVLVITPT